MYMAIVCSFSWFSRMKIAFMYRNKFEYPAWPMSIFLHLFIKLMLPYQRLAVPRPVQVRSVWACVSTANNVACFGTECLLRIHRLSPDVVVLYSRAIQIEWLWVYKRWEKHSESWRCFFAARPTFTFKHLLRCVNNNLKALVWKDLSSQRKAVVGCLVIVKTVLKVFWEFNASDHRKLISPSATRYWMHAIATTVVSYLV